jgi:hypothetical protein
MKMTESDMLLAQSFLFLKKFAGMFQAKSSCPLSFLS